MGNELSAEFAQLQEEYVNSDNLVRRELVEMLRMNDPVISMHDAAGVVDMMTQTGLIDTDTYFASEGERVVRAMKAGYISPVDFAHRKVNGNLIIPDLAEKYKWKFTEKGKIVAQLAIKSPYLDVEQVMSSARQNFGKSFADRVTDLIEKIEFYEQMIPTDDVPQSFINRSLNILRSELAKLSNAQTLTSEMNLAAQREQLTKKLDM
jgi:hypothetical protein